MSRPSRAQRPNFRRTATGGGITPRIIAAILAATVLLPAAIPGSVAAAGPRRGLAIRNDGDGAPPAGRVTPALPVLRWGGPVVEPANGTDPAAGAPGVGADTLPGAASSASGGGPGVVAGNAFAGLTDLDNNSTAPQCAGLTERPCGDTPGSWVATGPSHVLQVVNWRVRVTNRAGGAASSNATGAWFGVAPISPGRAPANTGARVLYDQAHRRWLAADLAYDCTGSVITVMVSKDPKGSPLPLGSAGWTRYTIAFPGEVAAYPTLGASSNLVAIGANRYPVTCAGAGAGTPSLPVLGSFGGSALLVLDWSALLAAKPTAPYLDLGPVLDPGIAPDPTNPAWVPAPTAFTYAPARQTSASSVLHVVVASKARLADPKPTRIAWTALTGAVGDGGSTATLVATKLAIVKGVTLADPPAPVDPGGTLDEAADFRITDAVWRSGRLALATTASSGGSAPRPRARVVELVTAADTATASATLAQVLTVAPTTAFTDTFMPGIAYANDGTLWAVYSQSGPHAFISSWTRRQLPADRLAPAAGPGTAAFSTGAARIAMGRDAYAGINVRWGDSVGVAADPAAANAGSVWQADAFADTLEGWATAVARLGTDAVPPAVPARIGQAFWNGHTVGRMSVAVTVSWGTSADTASGLASFDVQQWSGATGWTTIRPASPLARSVRRTLAFGVTTRFRVRAFDNAGNPSAWRYGPRLTPTVIRPATTAGVSLSGSWTWQRCSACIGGRSRAARSAGARASLRTNGWAIGWVTLIGPARGSARVSADGSTLGTFSTHASAGASRRLVTSRTFSSGGRHTFQVRVLGTRGHPRVDVDVFVVLR